MLDNKTVQISKFLVDVHNQNMVLVFVFNMLQPTLQYTYKKSATKGKEVHPFKYSFLSLRILKDFQCLLKDRGNILDKNSRAMKQFYSAT